MREFNKIAYDQYDMSCKIATIKLMESVAIGEVKALHGCWWLALHLMAFILPIACYAQCFSICKVKCQKLYTL